MAGMRSRLAARTRLWTLFGQPCRRGCRPGSAWETSLSRRRQRGCVALVVPPESPAQSVDDLRNQTIAGAKLVFGAPMADAGVDPDADVTWALAPSIANEVPTLHSGDVAAVQT